MSKMFMRWQTWALLALLIIPQIAGQPAAAAPPPWEIETLQGKPASSFTLPDMKGKKVSLNDFAGQVVLLNFWATWCGPCRKEMPALDALHQRYAHQGFTVLGVSMDDDAQVIRNFFKKITVTFPILHDSGKDSAEKYRVFALPTSFLIDRKGVVRQFLTGQQDWDSREFHAVVEKLLADAPPRRMP